MSIVCCDIFARKAIKLSFINLKMKKINIRYLLQRFTIHDYGPNKSRFLAKNTTSNGGISWDHLHLGPSLFLSFKEICKSSTT